MRIIMGVVIVAVAIVWVLLSRASLEFEVIEEQIGRVVESELELLREHSRRIPPLSGGQLERRGESEPAVTLSRDQNEQGQTVLTLALEGYSDDSVKGERFRWILSRDEDGKITVLEKGRQLMCWRGRDANRWISGTLCP